MTESFTSDTKRKSFKPFRNVSGNPTDCNIADDNLNGVPYQNDLEVFILQTLPRFRRHQKSVTTKFAYDAD